MSTITSARERLWTGWRVLQTQWSTSCDLWNDPVRHRFEREFWQEWERIVPATIEEMQKLAQVIAQARQSVQ